ncbi:MAG: hypothetical protein A2162_04195 [Deltaproteobacteria bacterium RBG_13_52_11b]|nr:MAG: hypothetical protein A2162_04195 [Deltaproteobacteria bacterium RBG_13_52_11b]
MRLKLKGGGTMKELKGGEMMHRRTLGFLTIIVIFSFLVSGCSYFSAKREMSNASRMVSELKGMDGLKLVPYEYTSAEKLLEISNKEFDQADYFHAKEFAERSKSAAEAGLSEVKKMKK